jgi:hypothetical protein
MQGNRGRPGLAQDEFQGQDLRPLRCRSREEKQQKVHKGATKYVEFSWFQFFSYSLVPAADFIKNLPPMA